MSAVMCSNRGRRYTDDVRAEFEGLARTIGTEAAIERMGVPRTTGYRWMRRPLPITGEMQTPKQVVDALWATMRLGITEVQRRMRDPKARLADVAQALRVVSEQHALLSGGPTARTENANVNVNRWTLSPDEEDALRNWIDHLEGLTPEQFEEATPAIVEVMRQVAPEARQLAEGFNDVG